MKDGNHSRRCDPTWTAVRYVAGAAMFAAGTYLIVRYGWALL